MTGGQTRPMGCLPKLSAGSSAGRNNKLSRGTQALKTIPEGPCHRKVRHKLHLATWPSQGCLQQMLGSAPEQDGEWSSACLRRGDFDGCEDASINRAVDQQQSHGLSCPIQSNCPAMCLRLRGGGVAVRLGTHAETAHPQKSLRCLHVNADLQAGRWWGQSTVDVGTVTVLAVQVELLEGREFTRDPPVRIDSIELALGSTRFLRGEEAVDGHLCLELCVCHEPEVHELVSWVCEFNLPKSFAVLVRQRW
eukprot:CAMPEP_0179096864 /NCGR_PEP_ID=MMETSP0796-20121207/44551_1 /TAXON_ID=73915 /ORGANISM="Pyrodinium bahamense, Strain pbaha01" /LENGTH=249 /DNA_ID=CAMNT_0020794591 /DNA_START=103 /DNA_END=853 /DNA_ORIENTATION=-